jgi:large subunit ribosomal protein L28
MITGKSVMTGNNVSHANNKTRRRFLPNLQNVGVMSDVLGRTIRLRLSVNGLRTIEHRGGLDSYLVSTPPMKTDKKLKALQKVVLEAIASRDSSSNH